MAAPAHRLPYVIWAGIRSTFLYTLHGVVDPVKRCLLCLLALSGPGPPVGFSNGKLFYLYYGLGLDRYKEVAANGCGSPLGDTCETILRVFRERAAFYEKRNGSYNCEFYTLNRRYVEMRTLEAVISAHTPGCFFCAHAAMRDLAPTDDCAESMAAAAADGGGAIHLGAGSALIDGLDAVNLLMPFAQTRTASLRAQPGGVGGDRVLVACGYDVVERLRLHLCEHGSGTKRKA
jgi:hypothetical protein